MRLIAQQAVAGFVWLGLGAFLPRNWYRIVILLDGIIVIEIIMFQVSLPEFSACREAGPTVESEYCIQFVCCSHLPCQYASTAFFISFDHYQGHLIHPVLGILVFVVGEGGKGEPAVSVVYFTTIISRALLLFRPTYVTRYAQFFFFRPGVLSVRLARNCLCIEKKKG